MGGTKMGNSIYQDIAERTKGSVYIGVIGPVRTGKSTFIKRFMDTIVIPNMDQDFEKERAIDELPQSAAGRTIMTTEPKFIPEQAVAVHLDDNASFHVRMIDCVGYIVPSSLGYVENDTPRMVMTPWFEEPIPFNMAAEIGTKKVITEHSTIGLVLTTDGSISDIPREEYEEAEERVITELKEIDKPFVVLVNCTSPYSQEAQTLCKELQEKYSVPVSAINCLELTESEIKDILQNILYQFPVKEIKVDMPQWLCSLEKEHWLRSAVFTAIKESAGNINRIGQVSGINEQVTTCEYVSLSRTSAIDLGTGHARITIDLSQELFYQILGEKTGMQIENEGALLECMMRFMDMKAQYDKLKDAYDDVLETGYGIVMPGIDELTLEEPQIIKQGGRYGIRLKAAAPSIQMMRTNITTEITPMVGSEQQSEDLISYLMKEFDESPAQIWQSNIFGKSLHELVNEGLHNKLHRMPVEARGKVRQTIERIINDGCNGLICIIL